MIPTRARVTKCLNENLESRCQDDRCPIKGVADLPCFGDGLCLDCTDDCIVARIVQGQVLTEHDYLQGAVVVGSDGEAYRIGDVSDGGKVWALHRYQNAVDYDPYPTRYKYFTCSDDFELWWR